MGIFDALNIAVSGLQSQSFALQNISGNIANSSTIGYKGINTAFEDMIPSSLTPNKQVAGGVQAFAQQTITTAGTISNSTIGTNIAINGDGFFNVQKPTGFTDGAPSFNGVTDYTRAGDFQVNSLGYLVNRAGYYLMGVSVDPKTGNPTGNVPQVLQFNNNFIPAQATSVINYSVNLPPKPATQASSTAAPGSFAAQGGLNQADFGANNPAVAGTPAQPFANASVVGNAALDHSTPAQPISASTLLSNLTKTVGNGDSITVDGTVINFAASTPPTAPFTATGSPPTISLSTGSTVGDLLTAVDQATGNTNSSTLSSIDSSGEVTLNSGTANDLKVTGDTAGVFSALGFTSGGLPAATRTGGGSAGTGFVVGNNVDTFNKESINGGAVTVFNSTGTPVNVQLRWAQISPGVWNLFYQSNPDATGSQVAWTNVGQNFTFNANGALTSPAGGSINIPNLAVGGQQVGNVQLSFGAGGLTQSDAGSGNATLGPITQNGFSAGQLQSVAIDDSGLVVGTFTNGQNIDLASITLSHFSGTNFLKALDGQAYAATQDSGPAIAGASGSIQGSATEGSNADIADEFAKLIVTQQAYSANTKVVTTASDMVQSLLNVLR